MCAGGMIRHGHGRCRGCTTVGSICRFWIDFSGAPGMIPGPGRRDRSFRARGTRWCWASRAWIANHCAGQAPGAVRRFRPWASRWRCGRMRLSRRVSLHSSKRWWPPGLLWIVAPIVVLQGVARPLLSPEGFHGFSLPGRWRRRVMRCVYGVFLRVAAFRLGVLFCLHNCTGSRRPR